MNTDLETKSPYKFIPLGVTLEEHLHSRRNKAAKIADILESQVGPLGSKVALDVGCHDGSITHYLSTRFAKTIGVDNDAEIIGFAGETYQDNNIEFRVSADAQLPVEDQQFDVVLLNHVLYYVADQAGFLAELRRVMKDDGMCYVAVVNGFYTNLLPRLPAWLQAAVTRFVLKSSFNSGNPLTYRQYLGLLEDFDVTDMTYNILEQPRQYAADSTGGQRLVLALLSRLPGAVLSRLARCSPAYIFLLRKNVGSRH